MENKNRKDELNYKKAYLFIFNELSNIQRYISSIQRKAEDICINEDNELEETEIDIAEALSGLVNNIKDKIEETTKEK